MVPTWNALPTWAKIVLAPLILSASITMIVVTLYAVIGVLTAIGSAFEAASRYFRKAKGAVAAQVNA